MHIHCILATKGTEVASIEATATARRAAEAMAEQNIGSLIVLDAAGTLVGILSERDVARAVHVLKEAGDALVHQLMSSEVTTCKRSDTIADVMRTMTEHRIRHLPVLDDDGSLCGIVSIGDVVKYRLDELEADAAALQEYIAIGR